MYARQVRRRRENKEKHALGQTKHKRPRQRGSGTAACAPIHDGNEMGGMVRDDRAVNMQANRVVAVMVVVVVVVESDDGEKRGAREKPAKQALRPISECIKRLAHAILSWR